MSLSVSSSGGGDFEKVPEGVYIARAFKIIDLGTQTIDYKGEIKFQKKVLISWELLDDEVKMKDGKPFAATKKYTASLDERGNLRPDLEAWRGKKFTDEELKSFDLKNVLGAYCQIQIVHSEDGKYANVNSIMSTKLKPTGVNPLVSFDVDEPDMEIFNTFSDKMKAIIELSPEFRAAIAPKDKQDDADAINSYQNHVNDEMPSDALDGIEGKAVDLSDIPF